MNSRKVNNAVNGTATMKFRLPTAHTSASASASLPSQPDICQSVWLLSPTEQSLMSKCSSFFAGKQTADHYQKRKRILHRRPCLWVFDAYKSPESIFYYHCSFVCVARPEVDAAGLTMLPPRLGNKHRLAP